MMSESEQKLLATLLDRNAEILLYKKRLEWLWNHEPVRIDRSLGIEGNVDLDIEQHERRNTSKA